MATLFELLYSNESLAELCELQYGVNLAAAKEVVQFDANPPSAENAFLVLQNVVHLLDGVPDRDTFVGRAYVSYVYHGKQQNPMTSAQQWPLRHPQIIWDAINDNHDDLEEALNDSVAEFIQLVYSTPDITETFIKSLTEIRETLDASRERDNIDRAIVMLREQQVGESIGTHIEDFVNFISRGEQVIHGRLGDAIMVIYDHLLDVWASMNAMRAVADSIDEFVAALG